LIAEKVHGVLSGCVVVAGGHWVLLCVDRVAFWNQDRFGQGDVPLGGDSGFFQGIPFAGALVIAVGICAAAPFLMRNLEC
jgi:hypothetical protein